MSRLNRRMAQLNTDQPLATSTEITTYSELHNGLISVCLAAMGEDGDGPISKNLVRLLRRSIRDLTETQLRIVLEQVRDTVQSVIDRNPSQPTGQIIDMEPINNDQSLAEMESVNDAIGSANIPSGN